MNRFTNKEIIKILEKILYFEGLRCGAFAERDREAILFRLSERELDQYDYSINRYNRILDVINWLKSGIFPDDPTHEDPISIDWYTKKYFSSQTYELEHSYDLLTYFEDKMLEEWKQKIKETQVMDLK